MIDFLGGRKNVLGYLFLFCITFLGYQFIAKGSTDYLGFATVVAAIAAGVGTLVWGNVKEHESSDSIKSESPIVNDQKTIAAEKG